MYKLIHYSQNEKGEDEFYNVGTKDEGASWSRKELKELVTGILNDTAGEIIEISPKSSAYFKIGDAQFCILTKKNNPISEKTANELFRYMEMDSLFNRDEID